MPPTLLLILLVLRPPIQLLHENVKWRGMEETGELEVWRVWGVENPDDWSLNIFEFQGEQFICRLRGDLKMDSTVLGLLSMEVQNV